MDSKSFEIARDWLHRRSEKRAMLAAIVEVAVVVASAVVKLLFSKYSRRVTVVVLVALVVSVAVVKLLFLKDIVVGEQ